MITLAAIASRLLAIYLVLTAISYSSYILLGLDMAESAATIVLIAIVGVAAPLAVAGLLWTKPLMVARAILPTNPGEIESTNFSESSLFSVLLAILGLYLATTAGAALAASVIEYIVISDSPYSEQAFSPSRWSPSIASALELIFGLILLFRPAGIKRLYFALKHGGLHHDSNPN